MTTILVCKTTTMECLEAMDILIGRLQKKGVEIKRCIKTHSWMMIETPNCLIRYFSNVRLEDRIRGIWADYIYDFPDASLCPMAKEADVSLDRLIVKLEKGVKK